ncbi:phosphodiester glycosidase family protein [Bifidobacterium leontopitheci]|uniref:Metallophosphoesterase n=1 Tax=Bifidobacterium leontopitheci TaxID=2650774 RepID=A0A6I1GHV4_9BIFI|nr:phosphodiester glycosidase family protein [Bifidobacterium leontopitheci]KAB7790242.1 metallophosphoesterase [Bifidobacterium leontopitheci]
MTEITETETSGGTSDVTSGVLQDASALPPRRRIGLLPRIAAALAAIATTATFAAGPAAAFAAGRTQVPPELQDAQNSLEVKPNFGGLGKTSAKSRAATGFAQTQADSGKRNEAAAANTVDGMVLDQNGQAIVNDLKVTDIAPGLRHYSFERISAEGRQPINILKATIGKDTVSLKYLNPGTVSGTGATVSDMTDSAKAVGGVNLDHFDINNSAASGGWGISGGKLVKSGDPGNDTVLGEGADGLARLVNLTLKGEATITAAANSAATPAKLPINRVNVAFANAGETVLFNAQWGAYNRGRFLAGAKGVEVTIGKDGVVTSVGEPAEGQLPDGVETLDAAADSDAGRTLAAVKVGDKVAVSYDFDRSMGDLKEAGGVWQSLISAGQSVAFDPNDTFATGRNPRTMLGVSQDGKTVFYVVADGRADNAVGMTFADEISLMHDLGAWDAVNVDGGGSSQMNVREPGDEKSTVQNQPSDGHERLDGDGLGFVLAKPASGKASGIAVQAASSSAQALRVFPGLHRTLTAKPYDETRSAAKTDVTWAAATAAGARGKVTVSADGVVAGVDTGAATVTATATTNSKATGSVNVDVLGKLTRLTASDSVISLTGKDAAATLALVGHDGNGFSAPVEARDAKVTGSKDDLVRIDQAADGSLKLTAVGDSGSETLGFDVDGVKVQVAVTVGLVDKPIVNIGDVFDKDNWYVSGARYKSASVVKAVGHDGKSESGEKITYDFSGETRTRTANTWPKGEGKGYAIPGQPKIVKVWAKGSTTTGNNPQTYIGFSDANGNMKFVYGDRLPGDWAQLSYTIPEGTAYPIKLEGLSIWDTGANQPVGEAWFDAPSAQVAPDVELPARQLTEDHTVIRQSGATDGKPQRIAILSDAQFVARDPNSVQANGARAALKEIVAAKPDALFIVGDLVDEASEADFQLAKQILDEGLKDATFPWYYVPGNHEVMGSTIDNFKKAALGGFEGATSGHVDIGGTRFITLNTADGTLSSDFSQVKMLRDQLDDAASNKDVTGVVIVQHMPIDDQNVPQNSQLGNRLDADMEREWISDFRAKSGKSVAMINGHVGDFYAKRDDGVPYVVNGNSGKTPTVAPQGAFVGWTMVGIDPAAGDWKTAGRSLADDNADWFTAETKVRAAEVALKPVNDGKTLEPGGKATVMGTVKQYKDADPIDIAWPMSVAWSGSKNLYVGDAAKAPVTAAAALDPTTGTLTALHGGTVTITATLDGVSASTTATIANATFTGAAKPVVSGSAKVGGTLTARLGDWADGADVSWQWLRDGAGITGATRAAYVPVDADAGHRLSVRATVSRDGYDTVRVESDQTAAVVAAGSGSGEPQQPGGNGGQQPGGQPGSGSGQPDGNGSGHGGNAGNAGTGAGGNAGAQRKPRPLSSTGADIVPLAMLMALLVAAGLITTDLRRRIR